MTMNSGTTRKTRVVSIFLPILLVIHVSHCIGWPVHVFFFLENIALVLHILVSCGVQQWSVWYADCRLQTRGKMQSADCKPFLLNHTNRVTRALFRPTQVLCNRNLNKCSTILRLTGVQTFTTMYVNNPVYA